MGESGAAASGGGRKKGQNELVKRHREAEIEIRKRGMNCEDGRDKLEPLLILLHHLSLYTVSGGSSERESGAHFRRHTEQI